LTIEDVAAMALGLPEAVEAERRGNLTWSVRDNAFAWERPFSKADLRRFGEDSPPEGRIVAVRVADLGEKEAVLAESHRGFFTIPHFDGFPAILIQLKIVRRAGLRDAITDAWLASAPAKLADEYLRRATAGRPKS
jgi:hypothetical protein